MRRVILFISAMQGICHSTCLLHLSLQKLHHTLSYNMSAHKIHFLPTHIYIFKTALDTVIHTHECPGCLTPVFVVWTPKNRCLTLPEKGMAKKRSKDYSLQAYYSIQTVWCFRNHFTSKYWWNWVKILSYCAHDLIYTTISLSIILKKILKCIIILYITWYNLLICTFVRIALFPPTVNTPFSLQLEQ